MSKGIWTKQLTPEGKAYYFNAAENRSLWQPPANSNIHEAPNLIIPSPEEFRQSQLLARDAATAFTSGTVIMNNQHATVASVYHLPNQQPNTNNSTLPSSSSQGGTELLTLEGRMAQAVANKQKELLSSKRAKTDEANSSMSDYQRQVKELKEKEGGNKEEGSKWLVR